MQHFSNFFNSNHLFPSRVCAHRFEQNLAFQGEC